MTPPMMRLYCILLLCWISVGQPEEVSIDVAGEVEGAAVRWIPLWSCVDSFPPEGSRYHDNNCLIDHARSR
jgi:hypothetical protein